MKREQLQKHWKVIEDFRNGKQIQHFVLSMGEWVWQDVSNPCFNMDTEYRIKPGKQVRWLNIYPMDNNSTKEEADKRASKNRVACVRIEYEEGEGL